MPRNKITIKDVAREAGVSTATVSYVINNRSDIRITEETRKKVMQVSNLLNYIPNQAAKALAANRKSLLAIYLPPCQSILTDAESLYITKELTNYFHQNEYEVILLNDQSLEKCDQADAIICYSTELSSFLKLGDNNLIPLLALDCMINDPLFIQVNTSMDRILEDASAHFGKEPYTYLTLPNGNQEITSYITDTCNKAGIPHAICGEIQDLSTYYNQKLLVTDHTLYQALESHADVYYLPSLSPEKLEALRTSMEATIQRAPVLQHNVLI